MHLQIIAPILLNRMTGVLSTSNQILIQVFGEARYSAITKAKGNYICFLDCDDVFVATKLEIQINQMHETNFLMSYGSSLIINENGKILKFKVKNNQWLHIS